MKKQRLGQRFGRLLVIDNAPSSVRKDGHGTFSRWKCLCDCGKELTVRTNNLVNGTVKSCGCFKKDQTKARYEQKHPTGATGAKRVFLGYKHSALKRGRAFSLTEEQFKQLNLKKCHYCGAPPSKVMKTSRIQSAFYYNGIDRKDNSKGYTIENCLPCCECCNKAKGTKTYDEFLAWIQLLIEFRRCA